ncbi:site-specific DNA-methyltransferase [Sphingomonas sp. CROZ-RG-20F-R02-07]|uniref:DNA-methyltransferase n=1 Tax=Sphingomonas sp. CROZ-RG-20F-R02-07 TaxID=2914832 RepID=UPI001F5A6EF1|nr:site-specific DNA-methyltransferase [Sphingomonas sp. CROZ-RG-20F-R02-07]
MRNRPTNHLYYGDNLAVLRKDIADASIDLIYLDPPFNSNASYGILFKEPDGRASNAQIEAFEDSWHWNDSAEQAFDDVRRSGNMSAFDLLRAMRSFLGDNDMMAYLTMMSVRLIELHRVLKPTGSLYLHCDPTASHYLKLLLDAVFGAEHFKNEIIWHYRRWTGGARRFQQLHDTILFYTKTDDYVFDPPYTAYTEKSLKRKQNYHTRVKGDEVYVTSVDERGVRENDVWQLPILNSQSKERLGYPTQKPIALLERIIAASSQEGDVVLDPFCGCGTAVHAAQKLGRQWVGIDITHLAVSLIEKRMNDAFPGIVFTVEGTPKDLASARDLAARDKYQFQWWAVSMVDALPFGGKKKGADGGIDGIIYFNDLDPASGRMVTHRAIVSVKGGVHANVTMVETLAATIAREDAPIGVLVMLARPTAEMRRRAAAVGLYRTGIDDSFPKLQILSLEDLFAGKRPRVPNVDQDAFRRAARENTQHQDRLL